MEAVAAGSCQQRCDSLSRAVMLRFAYRRYNLLFRHPVRTAHGVWAQREGVLLRCENEAGLVRFGEAAPIYWFGSESVDAVQEICRSFGEQISPDVCAAVPTEFACLRFALNSALGSHGTADFDNPKALPVAALLSAGRAALDQVAPKAEAGFRTFKWKVGVADIADELSLLDDLIAELPNGAKLRLDANGAWDLRRAERWLERCAERPVEFVEQPIAADAKGADDLLLGLARDHPTAIALDESVVSGGDVARWLECGWPGVFVLKPALLGDVTLTIEKLEKAKASVVFSSALETAVGAKAALQLAFAFGGIPRALGFGVWPLFQDQRFDGPHQAPFIRPQDVAAINEEAVWNALS